MKNQTKTECCEKCRSNTILDLCKYPETCPCHSKTECKKCSGICKGDKCPCSCHRPQVIENEKRTWHDDGCPAVTKGSDFCNCPLNTKPSKSKCEESELETLLWQFANNVTDREGEVCSAGSEDFRNQSKIVKSFIAKTLASQHQATLSSVKEKWLGLNLLRANKENWEKELTRFSLFIQGLDEEIK